jgi:hypothetical protein
MSFCTKRRRLQERQHTSSVPPKTRCVYLRQVRPCGECQQEPTAPDQGDQTARTHKTKRSEKLHSETLRGVQSLDYLEQAIHPDPTHSLVARFGINTNHAVQLSGRLNGGDRSVALLARRERRRRGEEGSGDDNLHGWYLYSLDGRSTESSNGKYREAGRRALAFGICPT